MNLNEARTAIYCRMLDSYTGVDRSLITFDNENFDEPIDIPWVRLTVRHSVRVQSTLGHSANRRFRTRATVFIQVYTKANGGTLEGDGLSTEAADIFEGFSFSGLDFGATTIVETGVSGKWYQHLVECRFDYDEIK